MGTLRLHPAAIVTVAALIVVAGCRAKSPEPVRDVGTASTAADGKGGVLMSSSTGSPLRPVADRQNDGGGGISNTPADPASRSSVSGESGQAPVVADALLQRGTQLFAKQCAICHGESGDGAGQFAYLMNPRPRDFQEGNFKLSTTENQIPSDEDLLRTITRGMPGSAMPPWGHLSKAELESLVAYVRQFHVEATREMLKQWASDGVVGEDELPRMLAERTVPGTPLAIPPEAPFDEVRWFNGRRLYLENCASCHGVDGNPVPEEVKFDAQGYPVPPRSFVNGIFKGGSEGHQLYARIVKGMKGTPMPASEGIYSDDEIWDLIHYVQSLARAGAQERAQLKQSIVVAPHIPGPLPAGPADGLWEHARPVYVGLTPLWWTEERIEGLVVHALHNGEELAIRLSWIDPSKDDLSVRHTEFRDAVAIQFALSSDPPFYMGDAGEHGGVNIWMWKADRQRDIAEGFRDVDAAYPARAVDAYPEQRIPASRIPTGEWAAAPITRHDPAFITAWGAENLVAHPRLATPTEFLVARGPGTLSAKPAGAQRVAGSAVYERGVWMVQLQRAMIGPHEHDDGDERVFRRGDYLPVSFAIWNGAAADRDGKKNISMWQKLLLE